MKEIKLGYVMNSALTNSIISCNNCDTNQVWSIGTE